MTATIDTLPDPATDLQLRQKFLSLIDVLDSEIVERSEVTYALVAAMIARSNLFMLSEPGTAKTMLADRSFARISGCNKGSMLFTPFTGPDEVFGPTDLPALDQGISRRNVASYMPDCHLFFGDEFWKGNEAIANALLWLANERRYKNGVDIIDAPLSTLVIASNEMPQSDTLWAIYDRIELRFVVERIKDLGNLKRAMMNKIDPNPTPMLDWSEVEEAQRQAAEVEIPEATIDQLVALRDKLDQLGFQVTDRRIIGRTQPVLKAVAWLEGSTTVELDHFGILAHMLWDQPKDRTVVRKAVLELANPWEKALHDLAEAIELLAGEVDKAVQSSVGHRLGMEIQPKLADADNQLTAILADVGGSRRGLGLANEVKLRLHQVSSRLIREVFDLDPSEML